MFMNENAPQSKNKLITRGRVLGAAAMSVAFAGFLSANNAANHDPNVSRSAAITLSPEALENLISTQEARLSKNIKDGVAVSFATGNMLLDVDNNHMTISNPLVDEVTVDGTKILLFGDVSTSDVGSADSNVELQVYDPSLAHFVASTGDPGAAFPGKVAQVTFLVNGSIDLERPVNPETNEAYGNNGGPTKVAVLETDSIQTA
jgi:hypothetical protein